MASIKNFGIQGVGSDVQFGKGGSRLVSDATGNFRLVNAANTANVRLTVSNGIADTDAVALGQLNAVANAAISNAAALQSQIDGVAANVATNSSNISALQSNLATAQSNITTLFSNVATQGNSIADLYSNAASQQAALAALANATSGSSTALQNEVDAIEAAVGLNADGSFAALTGTYVSAATTVKGAVEALDAALVAANAASAANAVAQQALIDANTKAISDEVTRATGVEAGLQTQINNEVTRATDAESAIANSVLIETIRAQGAESTIANSVVTETNRALAAESLISNAVTAEVTRATGVEGGLRTDLDALSAKVTGLGNVFNYKGTLDGSELSLDAVDATPAVGDYYKVLVSGTYTYGSSSIVLNAGDGVVKSSTGWDKIDNTDSAVFGTTDFVDVTGSSDTGYTVNIANTFVQRVATLEGKTSVDTSSLQSQIDAINANAVAESQRIDGVDAAQNAALAAEANARSAADTINAQAISDETTRATAAEAALNSLISNATTAYQAADAVLQGNIDAEVARATAAETALASNVSALFANAVSQQTAIDGLTANSVAQEVEIAALQSANTALWANAVAQQVALDALANATSGASTALQAEVDAIEAAVGLNADGSFQGVAGNYTSLANTVVEAVQAVDAAVKSAADAVAAETVRAEAAEAALSSNVANSVATLQAGIDSANAAVTAEQTRATGVEASLLAAIGNTNANVTTLTGTVSDLQAELDATQAGAGLSATGSYVAPASGVLANATSLANADDLLAAAILAETAARQAADNVQDTRLTNLEANATQSATAIANELDTVEASVGLAADGTLAPLTGTYVSNASTVVAAVEALDAALVAEKAALVSNAAAQQTAIDANAAALAQEVLDRGNAVADATNLLQTELAANVASINATISNVNAAYTAADALINANVAALAANAVLKDGSVAFTGDQSMGGHKLTNVADASVATDAINKGQLDAAIAAVNGSVASLGNAFNYVGTLANAGVDANSATDLSTLPAGGKDAGDYYKSTTAGYYTYGGTTVRVFANDGIVFNNAGGIDVLAHTESTVDGTANFVTVTGSVDTGFTVDLDAGFKARVSNAESNITTLFANAVAQQGLVGGLQTEVDSIESSVGLNADGSVTLGTSNYFGNASTLLGALKNVDSAVKTNTDGLAAEVAARIANVAALQTELDNTQTGAGLSATGAYVANASTNYLGSATSLADADAKLDAAIKSVQSGLSNLSQDSIVSSGKKYEVTTTDQDVEFLANLAGTGFTMVGNVVTAAAQDSTFTLSTAQAGQIRLEAHSSTASNVDIRLVPQGQGQVIVGETGTNGIIQADNGYDLTLAGGDQTGGTAGNVVLHGGQGSTNGSVIVKDGSSNTILTLTSGNAAVNGTLNTTATQVVLGAAGSASNIDIKLAPVGTGSVDASNARVVNVANAVSAQDAVTLSQLQAATGAAQSVATTGSLRAKTVSVTETTASTTVLAGVSGEAVRVKVYVNTAFSAGASISVVASNAGTLASSAYIDEATVGLYVIEVAPGTVLSNDTISVSVTAGSGSTGAAKINVEYLSA